MKNVRRSICFILTLVLLLCVGCGGVKTEETQWNPDAFTHYEEDNLAAYTVSATGEVYSVSLFIDDTGVENAYFHLEHYDEKAQKLSDYRFAAEYSGIEALAVQEQTVYFTADCVEDTAICKALYSFDGNSDHITRLAAFSYFEGISQLLAVGERIYILGNRQYSMSVDSNYGQLSDYAFQGEQLIYYDLQDGETYQLGYEKPISISAGADESVYVNCYMEGTGYCMTEYLPAQETVQIMAGFENYKFDRFALSPDAEEVIYTYDQDSRGLVLSPLSDIDEEAELYPQASNFGEQIYCVNHTVYLMDDARNIVSFSLDQVHRANKTIRYISPGYQVEAPYGCGYVMQRTTLEADKFTLKVLAQDSDYDLCLVNTQEPGSYNLKKNGVFYPLNSVAGIDEYLNRCFPYVREAAVREDGTIWMLPIAVSIPGLVADNEELEKLGLQFTENMTYEQFFEETGDLSPEELKRTQLNMNVLEMSFFNQYFEQNQSVRTEQFRRVTELFAQHHSDMPGTLGYVAEPFLYKYMFSSFDYTNDYYTQNYGEQVQVYGMPNLTAEGENMGYCVFLAVNPSSSRLKETLQYLEAWIAYETSQAETPLFFERDLTAESLYEKSLYELYKNGGISFSLEQDTYMNGFDDVIYHGADPEQYIEETDERLNMYFNE